MPSAPHEPSPSTDEDYFNDLSRQPPSTNDQLPDSLEEGTNGQIPKPKRIACILCRKRKLRCDGGKPSCGTCVRLQHDCSYDEVRRKSGPKRGYVKALESRLALVETLLKAQEDPPVPPSASRPLQQQQRQRQRSNGAMGTAVQDQGLAEIDGSFMNRTGGDPMQQIEATAGPTQSHFLNDGGGANISGEEPFPWEMIGLGLDEPLPTQDVIDELTQLYFDKIHPSGPMIHRPRYYAAMNLAPHLRPPVCLRYAMWCNAASASDKYEQLQEHFYHRARKYIQQDEMKGHGENMITVAHCQAWILLGTYEFKLMYFPRAWMSAGRAGRMAMMMGLHRLDGQGLDVKQCLAPPRDWTEREERRRTFWMSFAVDRYASIGTGWPMSLEEGDIRTNMPSDDESYDLSRQVSTGTLSDALSPEGSQNLSSFAGVILMACMFGRNLTHLHRPSADDDDSDLNGEFWRRHRNMDSIILNTALGLPGHLRLPQGINEANAVFFNMSLHTSTICLHQAAIFKADKNRMPAHISAESKVRCIAAAAEIANIMRQISHLDLSAMNPFISFCLYVGARVYVQYLKSRPKDAQRKAALQFLLSAMHAIKRKNPLTESFLVQLDVDLEAAGLEDSRSLRSTANRENFLPKHVPNVMEKVGDSATSRLVVFGDNGAAMYNNPNTLTNASGQQSQMDHQGNDRTMGFIGNQSQFDLPNRNRTPGSIPSSNAQDMDISPGDAGGENHTPNSSNLSSNNFAARTPNSNYSPAGMRQQQHGQQNNQFQSQPNTNTGTANGAPFGTIFDASQVNFTGFDMHGVTGTAPGNTNNTNTTTTQTFPAWNTTSTGLPLGTTGFTPNGSGVSEAFSDVDWNQMLDMVDFGQNWTAGVVAHDATMEHP